MRDDPGVATYNKVTEDAARGNVNAKEILAKATEIAKLAVASNQGPDAFRAAAAEQNPPPNYPATKEKKT